jgi:hypothetical protein
MIFWLAALYLEFHISMILFTSKQASHKRTPKSKEICVEAHEPSAKSLELNHKYGKKIKTTISLHNGSAH